MTNTGGISRWLLPALVILAVAATAVYWLYLPDPNLPGRAAEGEPHRVVADGFEHLYYERGSGRIILFLPSLGRPASDFNELTAELSRQGFRTIAVDLNTNRKVPEKSKGDLMRLAAQLDAVVTALGPIESGNLVVAGHAFGNRLARAYATLHPERVEAVILLAAGGRVPIAEDITGHMIDCFDPSLNRISRGTALRRAFFAQSSAIPDYWRIGWDVALGEIQVEAATTTPYELWWDGGGRPMLVIQADEDSIAPARHSSDLLKEEFGDRVTVAVASPAGHALLPEQPVFLSKTILAYLD